ncbi:1,4-dihydroxy-2-naphthoate prenyltransferase [Rubritalea squalenifaciens DSM 18772]|uniref:1,4-dihydroxy-2-naphthoate octaprenyltransferase n=1 Tax=Rubritalea squalenifaciens DSM 18772 TaxID=1123071 RepID=A0A1M6IHM1_9BACT|nr:1,4-dihydroxy-2-naphthoate octaprenyltransferase [Rubritalea squalenifaciens]SHJ33947.1 1,4-dihydroxy-2-naphthoate prenyltransferase [Rubritalea squalenifaciens DSM 18772]
MNLKPYILAARPKTLPAAIVPVWLGCMLTWKLLGIFDLWLASCTLMGAIWIQIATNFFNDAIDNDKGADTEHRLGPIRATASGLLSRRTVYLFAVLCLLISGVFGYFLYAQRGWPVVAIGIPSLYLCYGYTGGPVPLAYRGLGEIFVIFFFGVVAVAGTFFMQTGTWSAESILLGLQIGLLSAVLISINNLRDVDEDRSNDKRTLAVKLGVKGGKIIIVIETLLAFLLGLAWIYFGQVELFILPSLFMLLGATICAQVIKREPGRIYNKYLALGGLQLILFGGLFTAACLL